MPLMPTSRQASCTAIAPSAATAARTASGRTDWTSCCRHEPFDARRTCVAQHALCRLQRCGDVGQARSTATTTSPTRDDRQCAPTPARRRPEALHPWWPRPLIGINGICGAIIAKRVDHCTSKEVEATADLGDERTLNACRLAEARQSPEPERDGRTRTARY